MHQLKGFQAVGLSLMNKETPGLFLVTISSRLLLFCVWVLSIVLWAYYNANLTTTMTVSPDTVQFE